MTSKDLEQQLNSDIIRFLENIRNQTENDKIKTLRQLFDKYIHLNKVEYLMDNYDLNAIIGSAKQSFVILDQTGQFHATQPFGFHASPHRARFVRKSGCAHPASRPIQTA